MTQIAYPFRIDGRGRTADANQDDHIRQLIEQLLFTSPGERVNRPTFGTGLQQLVFAPNSQELATAVEFMIQGAIQEFLGELVQVERVSVESQDATLRIVVQYVVRRSQQREVAQFTRVL
jgi:phage baseplate assembly protein W